MANLIKIIKDGTETGATAADKINASFDKVDNLVSGGIFLADGTVPMTDDLDMGDKDIVNAGALRYNNDEKLRVLGSGVRITGRLFGTGDLGADNLRWATILSKKGSFTEEVIGRDDMLTVGPVDKEFVTKEWVNKPRETYELKGDNPNMSMHINAAGDSAQMQVIDTATGHIAATMEYYKPDASFRFDLAHPISGAIINEFAFRQDGKMYVNNLEAVVIRPVILKSADYTLTEDDTIVEATANTFTLTLPSASGISGKQFIIKNSGGGTVTVHGHGSEIIDLVPNHDVLSSKSLTIISNGTDWMIIN